MEETGIDNQILASTPSALCCPKWMPYKKRDVRVEISRVHGLRCWSLPADVLFLTIPTDHLLNSSCTDVCPVVFLDGHTDLAWFELRVLVPPSIRVYQFGVDRLVISTFTTQLCKALWPSLLTSLPMDLWARKIFPHLDLDAWKQARATCSTMRFFSTFNNNVFEDQVQGCVFGFDTVHRKAMSEMYHWYGHCTLRMVLPRLEKGFDLGILDADNYLSAFTSRLSVEHPLFRNLRCVETRFSWIPPRFSDENILLWVKDICGSVDKRTGYNFHTNEEVEDESSERSKLRTCAIRLRGFRPFSGVPDDVVLKLKIPDNAPLYCSQAFEISMRFPSCKPRPTSCSWGIATGTQWDLFVQKCKRISDDLVWVDEIRDMNQRVIIGGAIDAEAITEDVIVDTVPSLPFGPGEMVLFYCWSTFNNAREVHIVHVRSAVRVTLSANPEWDQIRFNEKFVLYSHMHLVSMSYFRFSLTFPSPTLASLCFVWVCHTDTGGGNHAVNNVIPTRVDTKNNTAYYTIYAMQPPARLDERLTFTLHVGTSFACDWALKTFTFNMAELLPRAIAEEDYNEGE
jgi:hypothetical protein